MRLRVTKETDPGDDSLSPLDMQRWLERESADVLKAAELRLNDAKDFVARYVDRQGTREEMMQRFDKYNLRWPEALPGVTNQSQLTDDEILRQIDERSHRSRRSSGPSR